MSVYVSEKLVTDALQYFESCHPSFFPSFLTHVIFFPCSAVFLSLSRQLFIYDLFYPPLKLHLQSTTFYGWCSLVQTVPSALCVRTLRFQGTDLRKYIDHLRLGYTNPKNGEPLKWGT